MQNNEWFLLVECPYGTANNFVGVAVTVYSDLICNSHEERREKCRKGDRG